MHFFHGLPLCQNIVNGIYLAIIYVVDSSCTLNIIQSVYKRTYIKSPVELCGSIFFLAALRRVVEADKLVVK
jgi:hypothetical protein